MRCPSSPRNEQPHAPARPAACDTVRQRHAGANARATFPSALDAGCDVPARRALQPRGRPRHTVREFELVDIGPVGSSAEYSHFVLRRLPEQVVTTNTAVTQWDGFVVDPAQWRDEFLEVDCIGASKHDQSEARCVGNGGLSLRSQRLLQAGRDPRVTPEHPEDRALCRDHRDWLEAEHDFRFAPHSLARRFAFENLRPAAPTFGFCGPDQLPRFVDATKLAGWIDALPGTFYRSRDARRLARALLRFGMARTAVRLLERRRAAGRREPSTLLLGLAAAALLRLRAKSLAADATRGSR